MVGNRKIMIKQYILRIGRKVEIPKIFNIIHLAPHMGVNEEMIHIWAEVDFDIFEETTPHEFLVRCEGLPYEPGPYEKYLGTVHFSSGLVYHIYDPFGKIGESE